MERKSKCLTCLAGIGWIIFTVLLFFSCNNNQELISPVKISNAGNQGNTGELRLMLTDDPFLFQNVSQVNVTIYKIELRKKDSTDVDDMPDTVKEVMDTSQMDNEEHHHEMWGMAEQGQGDAYSNNDKDSSDVYVTVLNTPQEVNLMNLRNGITIDMADTSIQAGTYDMIRLYISKASVVMNDGTVFNITIPGGSHSGLKIFIPSGIVVSSNQSASLLVDFNLSHSLECIGRRDNPLGFILNPVIRAVNDIDAGKVYGFVKDTGMMALKGAYLWLKGDSVISSTVSEENGFYQMIGIPDGSYTLYAALAGYDTASVQNVHVSDGDHTREDIELKPAK